MTAGQIQSLLSAAGQIQTTLLERIRSDRKILELVRIMELDLVEALAAAEAHVDGRPADDDRR